VKETDKELTNLTVTTKVETACDGYIQLTCQTLCRLSRGWPGERAVKWVCSFL